RAERAASKAPLGTIRARAPGAGRGLYRAHARVAGGCGRARALDRRPDRARGPDARLPGDLLRLGTRPRAGGQRGGPALRPPRRAGRGAPLAPALAAGRTTPQSSADLPSAASFVLAAAGAG